MQKTILKSSEDLKSIVLKMLENHRNFLVSKIKEDEHLVILFDNEEESWNAFERLLESGSKKDLYMSLDIDNQTFVFRPKRESILIFVPDLLG